jgi:hypothetical protein
MPAEKLQLHVHAGLRHVPIPTAYQAIATGRLIDWFGTLRAAVTEIVEAILVIWIGALAILALGLPIALFARLIARLIAALFHAVQIK